MNDQPWNMTDLGIFGVRGNLDGGVEQNYSQREQFIGLKIGIEEFYMPISVVNEIVMLQPITLVPQSHIFIEGVINLRGTIMPAINLRKMMGLSRATVTPATRMIIIAHEETPLALLVDGITYVISLWATEIDDQSLPSRSLGADFIARISKGRDRIVGIIDPSKILFQMIDSDVLEESKKKNENE